MSKAEHEREVKRVTELMQEAVDREFQRAMTEGRAQVRRWAVDANAEFFTIDMYRAKGAAIAAFQQAASQFGPAPLTLSDVLYAPADVKEAIDAVTGS
jgi:hypothetical protein